MGLVMLGSASEKALDEMLQYAHETQHEKIIRGLAMGIAFMFYGRQEQADKIIDTLLSDKVCSLVGITPLNGTDVIIIGPYSTIWRCLYHRHGLRWNR